MNKIWLIIKREYLVRVRKRSFIIMTILGPLLMAGIIILPTYLAMQGHDERTIALHEKGNFFSSELSDSEGLHFVKIPSEEVSIIKEDFVSTPYYALLDIKKGDYEKTKSFHVQNFSFFGAPLGLIFTIEKDLGWMSWLDYGMFLQNICIAARAYGLHTCAQASWSGVHEDISPLLKISENHLIHCGMSIGMEDKQAVVNQLRTDRADLDDFVTFYE